MNHPAAIAVVTPRDPATNLCAASASLLLLLLLLLMDCFSQQQQQRGWWWWWWRVNEASIDSSSILEVDFFINAFTTTMFVRSFIFFFLSLSLSNATH